MSQPEHPVRPPRWGGPTSAGETAVTAAQTDRVNGPADPAADADPEPQERSRLKSTIEWVAVIAGAVVVALLVRTFLFTTFWIPSDSMKPTLVGEGRHDRVVVNRLSYKLHDVGRGDIIVFDVPKGEAQITVEGQRVKQLIKRVVGLPGETVSLDDGNVLIDGKQLAEPYLPDGTTTEPCPGVEQKVFKIPKDAVFVMGDNRDYSRDARCWPKHYVPEDDIVGRAFVRIWPLNHIGGI